MQKDELVEVARQTFGEKAVIDVELSDYGDAYVYLRADLGKHAYLGVDLLVVFAGRCDRDLRDLSLRDYKPNVIELRVDMEQRTPVETPNAFRRCPTCNAKT